MPAKDKYHDAVVAALVAEGWTITDDPLRLGYGSRTLWIDLGAQREALAAEKNGVRIAVEIKTFLRPSAVEDLEKAVGQYNIYRDVLSELEPDRTLYLAIPFRVYDGIFEDKLGRLILKRQKINLLVFDQREERTISWVTNQATN